MRIYTITTARAIDMRGAADGIAGLVDASCVGFFTDMDEACDAVLQNAVDIHELDNGVAIVEAIDEGLYGSTNEQRAFFMWGSDGRYHQCDWPEALGRVVGFSMG